MAQLKAKQIRFLNQGDIIVAGSDANGKILSVGTQAGQALVVKNVGTDAAPKFDLDYELIKGSNVVFDDSVANLGATTVQDAIVKMKDSVTGALLYTGTVDASTGTFTPALPTPLRTGVYYQVAKAGNNIQTNNTGAANEQLMAGDAIVWNGSYWDVMAHIDSVISGTAGQIVVTGNPDAGFVAAIDPTYIGQKSITTLGTITTGIWNGTKIDLANGGTNTDLSKLADNSILFKSGTGVSVTNPSSGQSTNNIPLYLGYDASKNEFVWFDANQMQDQGKKVHSITEEFTVVANNPSSSQIQPSANAKIGLQNTPVDGTVSVYINGLRLGKNDITVAGSTVSLVDSSIGYSIEATDVIDISYDFVTMA